MTSAAKKRTEAAIVAIVKRNGGLGDLCNATKVLTGHNDIQSLTAEQARELLFAKLDDLARDAQGGDSDKRKQARVEIEGFVMLLEKVAIESPRLRERS